MRASSLIGDYAILLLIATVHGLNFAVIGDWGMGGYPTGWWPEIRSAQALNEICAKLSCNFTISCGDNIYVGDVLRGLAQSFEASFTSQGPFFPCIGNHDNWGPQVQYTRAPGQKRWKFPSRFYTYKLPIDHTGYTVQLFALDGNSGDLAGGGQLAWLESELNRSDARWKILFSHYPTVGSGRHRRVGTVSQIHRLMETYNAQAYFSGHDHLLEMSNMGGRVLGISGAMARGGMMYRGLGGEARRFTLTQPSEYNPYKQDWPGYGIITVRLSPNVMNVQLWDHYQAIQYDFSVTHRWMQQVKSRPVASLHRWPPSEVLLEAYREEVTLPIGPGGGTTFGTDGVDRGGPSAAVGTQTPMGPSASTAALPTAAPSTPPPMAQAAVPSFAQYAVSTECGACAGPVLGKPFTIMVYGFAVDSATRIFLSYALTGCEDKARPAIVNGTGIASPDAKLRNTFVFTASGAVAEVFVCLSVNGGKQYSRLPRFDTQLGGTSFVLDDPPPTAGETAAPAKAATTNAPVGVQHIHRVEGHSTSTLIAFAVGSMVFGTVIAFLFRRR